MQSLADITSTLASIKPHLATKYGVNELAVFGSYARNQQNDESDVDILVTFSRPIGIEFVDLADELESALHVRVDLVSRSGIKAKYLSSIASELKYV